ncbi:MAG: hypothetical protein WBC40_03440 [Halobacteriota archaeon]
MIKEKMEIRKEKGIIAVLLAGMMAISVAMVVSTSESTEKELMKIVEEAEL